MKTKFTIVLTALLMLFGMGVSAQVKGDVNGDSKVTEADIEEVIKVIMGTSTIEGAAEAADVNGDEVVNVADIVEIARIFQADADVKVTIKNAGSTAFTISAIKFVLVSGEGETVETEKASVTQMIEASGEASLSISVPNSSSLKGLHFANESQLNGNPSNIVFYDQDGNASTIVAESLIDASETLDYAGNYTVSCKLKETTPDPVVEPDPEPTPSTGNATVKLTIKNNGSTDIPILGVKFVLASGETKRTNITATIPANQSSTISVEVEDGAQLAGQTFATEAQLNGNKSNVVLYTAPDWSSTTYVPSMVSSSTKFAETLELSVECGSASTPTTPTTPTTPVTPGAVTTTVTITNQSGSTKTFDGKVCFVVYGTLASEGYTGYFRLKGTCSGNDFTIANGASKTYTVTFDTNNQNPTACLNMPFATAAQRGQYQCNNSYYISGSAYTCNDFSNAIKFTQGGTYNMVIPASTHEWTSGSSGSTQTGGNVNCKVTIVNESGSAKTFQGIIGFIVYGTHPNEPYTGYFRFKGTCSGDSFTIPAGGSRTYNVVFQATSSQSPSVGLGMPFATQAQRNQFITNNGYYINGSCYTCKEFPASMKFVQNGTYTMTIPANTREWSPQ